MKKQANSVKTSKVRFVKSDVSQLAELTTEQAKAITSNVSFKVKIKP